MAFNLTLRKSFLYIFATVGLVISIIGAVSLINLAIKSYILTKADNYCYNYAYPMSVDKEGKSIELTQQQKDEQKKQCEEQRTSQKQSQAANAIAMLIVGLPLYGYH
ncbi:MAG TPA: hypothetical protein VGQ87_00150, partial [Patescibacteria group bacterium]|nr:hypothetical protein [Patescibacteria group bacterium]